MGHEPGIVAAGIVSNIPLSGDDAKSSAHVEGYVPDPDQSPRAVYSYSVGGEYFKALGIPLRAGRYLTAADAERPQRVCVVDEDFARRYFPLDDRPGRSASASTRARPPRRERKTASPAPSSASWAR